MAPSGENDPPYLTVTLDVSKVIWKRHASLKLPSKVNFLQTGAVSNGTQFEIEDDPLLDVSENVILFFKEYEPGKYRVSGGPTGRFQVVESIVRPVVVDGVKVPVGTTVDQLSALR